MLKRHFVISDMVVKNNYCSEDGKHLACEYGQRPRQQHDVPHMSIVNNSVHFFAVKHLILLNIHQAIILRKEHVQRFLTVKSMYNNIAEEIKCTL